MKHKITRMTALLIVFVMLFFVVPMAAFAVGHEAYETASEKDKTEQNAETSADRKMSELTLEKMPEFIRNTLNKSESKAVEVIIDDYDDTASITTLNEDGSKTLTMFENPIKYYDRAADLYRYIDNTLVESAENGIAYKNETNGRQVLLPEKIGDGVSISSTDENGTKYSVTFKPFLHIYSDSNKSGKTGDSIKMNLESKVSRYGSQTEEICEYSGVFGAYGHLQYVPTDNGVKENIVLDKNPGTEEFSFVVSAEGMTARLSKQDYTNGYELFDGEKQSKTIYYPEGSRELNQEYGEEIMRR